MKNNKLKTIKRRKIYLLIFIPIIIFLLLIFCSSVFVLDLSQNIKKKKQILDYYETTVTKRNNIMTKYTALTKTLNTSNNFEQIIKANNIFLYEVNEFHFFVNSFPSNEEIKNINNLNKEYAELCIKLSNLVNQVIKKGTEGEKINPFLNEYNKTKSKLNVLNDEIYEETIDLLKF